MGSKEISKLGMYSIDPRERGQYSKNYRGNMNLKMEVRKQKTIQKKKGSIGVLTKKKLTRITDKQRREKLYREYEEIS